MTTLYRTYRPQTFADITGQEHVVQTLQNEVALGRVAHAYLFSGPRGVGKTTLARILAKAVNCERRKPGEAEPCGQCPSCLDITAGRHLDVIEIDAASHTGVDNVRENIIENAQFHPARAKDKVFIIDEVHMLSGSAFNALLKTLEEPPAHVIFVLATTELHKLPATVVSRCQRFQFKKIPYEQMLARLKTICAAEQVKVDKEVLQRIINKSDGCLRDAESLLGQILSLNRPTITPDDVTLFLPTVNIEQLLNYAEHSLAGRAAEAIHTLQKLAAEGTNLDQFALDLLELGRALLIYQTTKDFSDAGSDYAPEALEQIKTIARGLSPAQTVTMLDAVLRRRQELKTAPLPELPLELLAVELGLIFSSAPGQDAPALSLASAGVSPPPASAAAPLPTKKRDAAPATLPETPSKAQRLTNTIKQALTTLTSHRPPPQTSLAVVQERWAELVTSICAKNHALTFILSMATPTAVDSAGLHLSVPYSLHRDKLLEAKNKHLIEENVISLFGEPIPLACAVASDAPAPADPELTALAVEFGGEVVG